MTSRIFSLLCGVLSFAQSPTFDGIVTHEEWENTQVFSIDYEIDPSDNTPAPYKTEVFVTHTESDIYVGFIAHADMSKLRSSLRNRDQISGDDNVAIGIDTYGDGRSMIVLGANPEGSQFDFKVLPSGDEDSYDLNFEVKASKHKSAYHVEFKIPVSELKFSLEDIMKWKVVFARSAYTGNTQIQMLNFAYNRSNPCMVCQTPDQITLDNIKPKKRVNLIPYVFGGRSGNLEDDVFIHDKIQVNVGLSGLFDISNTTTLEFALNPDFSQVEADVSQINANNTFALFFPERRPYFNEGNDIINSNQSAVYTRAINDPIASTKLIHQGEKKRLYWLTAYDENAPYLVGGENQSYSGEGGAAWANIFSYQRTFKGGSHIGILTTNRFFKEGGNGQLLGLNSLIRLAKAYTLKIEWNLASVEEPKKDWIDSNNKQSGKTVALDGETKKGSGLFFSLDRNTRNWNTYINYKQYSPHFEAPLGFVTQNNMRNTEIIQQYVTYPKNKDARIQQCRMNLGTEFTYNFGGTRKYFDFFYNARLVWKANWRTNLNVVHVMEEEYEGFVGKNMAEYSLWNSYNPSEGIRLGLFVSIGEGLRYDKDQPSVGKSFFIGSFNTFQPTSKLRIRQSIRYSQMRSKVDNSFYYKGYIARVNMNYQFTKDLSFRIIGEYNEFDDELFVQPLLKWNPNPATVFFIGGSRGYMQPESNKKLRLDNSQIYMKFQYLFDI